MQWEYHTEKYEFRELPEDCVLHEYGTDYNVDRMNELGNDGWELVAVDTHIHIMYFKRRSEVMDVLEAHPYC